MRVFWCQLGHTCPVWRGGSLGKRCVFQMSNDSHPTVEEIRHMRSPSCPMAVERVFCNLVDNGDTVWLTLPRLPE